MLHTEYLYTARLRGSQCVSEAACGFVVWCVFSCLLEELANNWASVIFLLVHPTPLQPHPLANTHTSAHALPLAVLCVDWLLVTSSQIAQNSPLGRYDFTVYNWWDREEQETDSELNPHHHRKGLAHLQSKTQGRILWQRKTTEVCIHIHTHSSKSVGRVEQKGRVQGIVARRTVTLEYSKLLQSHNQIIKYSV